MPGLDSRQRRFLPINLSEEKGLNIDSVTALGNIVKLKISYEFTFFGANENYDAQIYKWNVQLKQWEVY